MYWDGEMKFETLRVRYLEPGMEELVPPNSTSNWVDLRSAETIRLLKWQIHDIRLGVAIELPDGYEALIAPRSSTTKKFGVLSLCMPGVIDLDYKGDNDEWHFPVIALRDTVIHKNDRICQFRIIDSQPCLDFKYVDELGNPNRGGIGSTGHR